MTTGLIIGLLVGAALGLVVGLLVRGGHVAAARTAEARLADADQANQRLAAELAAQRQQVVDHQAAEATHRAEAARLTVELEHERRSVYERAAEVESVFRSLAGEFARLSGDALQKSNEQFLLLADTKLQESRRAEIGRASCRERV